MSSDAQLWSLGFQPEGWLAVAANWLHIGGPVVALLLAMSIAAAAIVLAKLYQFTAMRVGHRGRSADVVRLYRSGRGQQALLAAQQSAEPVARLLALAIGGRMRVGVREDLLREEVYRVGADILETLRAYLRPLEVIASLAPLLGLLGTVIGMIDAFQHLQAAEARVDPSALSGGIWEALLTTAVGLAVAIPAVAAVNYFDRRLARLAHDMNDAVTQIFTQELLTPECKPEGLRADDNAASSLACTANR